MFTGLRHIWVGMVVVALVSGMVPTAAGDGYLRMAGPAPLRFQVPPPPAPPPRPLPPPVPAPVVSMPPPEAVRPVATEPTTAAMPPVAVPEVVVVPKPGAEAMRPLTTESDVVAPQSFMRFFVTPGIGTNRTAAPVLLGPTFFTPAQPAPVQPSSATYTVKP